MRKRKANPSLELAAGLEETSKILGGEFAPEPRELAYWVSRPTGLQSRVQSPYSHVHTIDANVATGGTVRPPSSEGVDATLELEELAKLAPTSETVPTPQEGVLPDMLQEEEADVAGEQATDPHWFWELLEQVGYDVW